MAGQAKGGNMSSTKRGINSIKATYGDDRNKIKQLMGMK